MFYHYTTGQTPLDEEEKRDLIPSIVTREDLHAFEQENILEARKWVMQKSVFSRLDIFSQKFLLNLHKRMYGYVWKWAGTFRKTNKNIGVDRIYITSELHQLLGDAQYWLEHQTYSISDMALIFHHRLVKIHLFPRHARMCADVIVARFGGAKLSWGEKLEIPKPDEIRARYIAALREADNGNYKPLLEFGNY
jgi:Fic-DOC domain mobile mystery protein B